MIKTGGGKKRLKRTRDRILLTAARLLRIMGYEELRVEDIMLEADVCRSTFYKYFKGKADLLMAMVQDVAEKIETAIVPIRNISDPKEVSREVIANMHRIVDVFESSLPLFRVLFGGGRWTGGMETEVVASLEERMISIIRDALAKGKMMNMIRSLDLEIAALAIWGTFHKVILQPLARGLVNAEEARRRVPLLVDYHVGALVKG